MTKYVCTTPLRTPNHAGISLCNLLVADYLSIMLCNSSGLTIGDLEPFVEAEDQYRLSPEDIFGLGCLLGEISIGLRPEIESIDQLWNIHDHLVSILDIVSRAGGYMERRTNMRASLGIPRWPTNDKCRIPGHLATSTTHIQEPASHEKKHSASLLYIKINHPSCHAIIAPLSTTRTPRSPSRTPITKVSPHAPFNWPLRFYQKALRYYPAHVAGYRYVKSSFLNTQYRKSHLTRPRLSSISSLPVPLLLPRYLAYRICVMSFWLFQSCPLPGVFGVKVSVAGWYAGLLFLGVWLLGDSIANGLRLQGGIMDIIAVTESGILVY